MAKTEDVGLIEQHVEKAVLAVSIVAMGLVAWIWVMSSPRQIELPAAPEISLPQKTFAPSEVDEAVAAKAERMEKAIEDAQLPKDPVPNYVARVDERFLTPLPPQVGSFGPITAGRAPLQGIDIKERIKTKLADLLPLPAPRQPVISAQIEVLAVPDPQGNAYVPKESVVGHVAMVYDFGQVIEKWRTAMQNARIAPYFTVAAVEVQRQVRQADGSWGDPQSISRTPAAGGVAIPPLPAPTAENVQEVRQAIGNLSAPDVQAQVVEPNSYNIYDESNQVVSWIVKKPRTPVSDLQAVPAMFPPGMTEPTRGPSMETPPMRRPSMETPPMRRPSMETPPMRRPSMETPPMRRPSMETPPTRRPALDTPPTRRPTMPGTTPPSMIDTPPTRRPTMPGTTPPSMVETVPMPRPAAPEGRPAGGPEGGEGAILEVTNRIPALHQQLANPEGIMEVWAHDADLKEGIEYRYRLRLVLINPLFGEPSEVENPADADKLTLDMPWSPWSEAAVARRPMEFFISGKGMSVSGMDSLFVTVFTRKWNTWVSRQFRVMAGSAIGEPDSGSLTRPDGQIETVSVDFSTGAVVVDLDFSKKVRLPNSPVTQTTAEMVYLDSSGQLATRTEKEDEDAPRFRELKGLAQEFRR